MINVVEEICKINLIMIAIYDKKEKQQYDRRKIFYFTLTLNYNLNE